MLATLDSLTREAHQLKAAGRLDAALVLYLQAAQRFPLSGVALHNVAGILGDLGQHTEAAEAASRALKMGLDAPETWLVLARAELGRGELDAAMRGYREALRRQPNSLDAQFEATQLIWMTTGDRVETLRGLEAAMRKPGAEPMLCMIKAQALEFMDDSPAALAALADAAAKSGCPVHLLAYAAHLAAETGDPAAAISFAESRGRLRRWLGQGLRRGMQLGRKRSLRRSPSSCRSTSMCWPCSPSHGG
jgi:tetratricopeptide (TPR) repeat protein